MNAPDPTRAPLDELRFCPRCQGGRVYPDDTWMPPAGDDGTWPGAFMRLRCPDCEWRFEGLFDFDRVEVLHEQLERGRADLAIAQRCGGIDDALDRLLDR